jgi:hypothetical protein
MISTLKPGDVALAFLPSGAVRLGGRQLVAFKVHRSWISAAGTLRVEPVYDGTFRPDATFDRRQCISAEALENLSAGEADAPQTTVAAPLRAGPVEK